MGFKLLLFVTCCDVPQSNCVLTCGNHAFPTRREADRSDYVVFKIDPFGSSIYILWYKDIFPRTFYIFNSIYQKPKFHLESNTQPASDCHDLSLIVILHHRLYTMKAELNLFAFFLIFFHTLDPTGKWSCELNLMIIMHLPTRS